MSRSCTTAVQPGPQSKTPSQSEKKKEREKRKGKKEKRVMYPEEQNPTMWEPYRTSSGSFSRHQGGEEALNEELEIYHIC